MSESSTSLTGESHADATDADASVLANYPHSQAVWEITKGNYPGGNQLDVPNQDELWAALVARHFERMPTEHRGHRTSCSTSERRRSRLWAETETFREEPGVRDIETIDGELRLMFRAWHVARVLSGRPPSTVHIDELLDERAAAQFAVGSGQGLS